MPPLSNASAGNMTNLPYLIWYLVTAPPFILPTRPTMPEYFAVVGYSALLPCKPKFSKSDGIISLIKWYHGESIMPIYTLDVRKRDLVSAKHFPNADVASRVSVNASSKQLELSINPVKLEDDGIYKCQIEFSNSTINYASRLNVIVPPSEIIIVDSYGTRINDIAGPYDEGSDVDFFCDIKGGVPKPKVMWWRDSELVDSTYTETTNGTIQNILSMTNLHRRDNLCKYTCVGVNNNLTFPMTSTIKIDLNLKPIDVKITSSQSPLYAGKQVQIVCESWGGRPKTILSWLLDNEILATQELNSSQARSVLTFLPMAEYDGKTLYCKAVNPLFPRAVLKYHWKVVVLYIPKLTVRFGLGIQPDQIREKSDVYLDCLVDANPPIDSIQWYFQGEEVNTITSFGIFQSNHSLVLRNVTKQWAGGYACGATNVIGTSRSQEIRLLVKYAPTCSIIPNPVIVELGMPVTIICEADAYPSAVTYKWSFSHHDEKVSSSMSSFINVSEANASFIANVRHIGGVTSCWAANSIGEQMDPCTAEISLAEPPDPVESCTVTNANQTEMPVHVICQFGKPKGLNERFHLEVFDSAMDILIENISKSKPEFFIHDMNSTTPYTLLLYASNNKGKSEIVSIVANSLPVSKEIFSAPVKGYTSLIQEPLFFAPLSVILLPIPVCVFIFLKRKRRRKRQLTKSMQKASDERVEEEIEMRAVADKDDTDGQITKSNPDLIQNIPTELTEFCQKTTETSVEYKIEYTYTLTKGSTARSS